MGWSDLMGRLVEVGLCFSVFPCFRCCLCTRLPLIGEVLAIGQMQVLALLHFLIYYMSCAALCMQVIVNEGTVTGKDANSTPDARNVIFQRTYVIYAAGFN